VVQNRQFITTVIITAATADIGDSLPTLSMVTLTKTPPKFLIFVVVTIVKCWMFFFFL